MPPTDARRPRALIADYVPVSDSRPNRQIRWLEVAGYQVDTLSRGGSHPAATGRHFEMAFPPLLLRLAAYAALPNRTRFRYLIDSRIPAAVLPAPDAKYDVVVVHDLDLLPWVAEHARELTDGPVLLDLHEYFEGYGVGLSHRLLFARYQRWLFGYIADPAFTVRTTVADGIADLYAARLGVPRPVVVRNAPSYSDLAPTPVDPDRIRLIYHGRADLSRGLPVVLDAFARLGPRFELTFMVVGSDAELASLRALVARRPERIDFLPPVPMADVAATINGHDVEVVFYPPATENLRFFLPNKFFEAIQGRLAIVAGESPSLAAVIREYGNGAIVSSGWGASDLAAGIEALTADGITAMKAASGRAAADFNAERERDRFLEAIGAAS